jgi:methylmalonyl-CoA mutase N-terminal domain/subunit
MYLVAAERQGVSQASLAGTLQNDILKEFLARKTFVFPPEPSMRLSCDVIEFAAGRLPRFNPISITGYHAREAGCDAVQELALTLASAIAYAEALVARGLAFDDFAPRLSFHFATTMDLFEEVAKLRAARRMWSAIATDRFGARDPESGRLRFFSGNSGTTLTAQQPLNNIIRSTIQCLGAVLGGAQSIHVMGYDEAFEIPSEEAVTLSLRTQQIVALESGVPRTADPLGGSYFVEALTDELEARANDVLAEIEALGGAVAAIEQGVSQRWIADSAYRIEREIASGVRPRVGVNVYADPEETPVDASELFAFDPSIAERQIARTAGRVDARDPGAAAAAIAAVEAVAGAGDNVLPPLLDAVRVGATLGELADAFRAAFGEFREPHPW